MLLRKFPSTYDKALELNLDRPVYGTFAEIGAGQEVANWFFRVGAASVTIAKTMSAYDMVFSDEVYGPAAHYVSRERLLGMLKHEFDIVIERLQKKRGRDTTFFAFANTVRARGYQDTGECHGWMGIRFQIEPGSPPQDILLHARLLDQHIDAQKEVLGIAGVNLVYGAFHHLNDLPCFVRSLLDNLSPERIEIDMLKFEGGSFDSIDNRLCALQLVHSDLTEAALFDHHGEVLQPAEQFYKKPILLLRGSFDPVTKVNLDMLHSAARQFRKRLPEGGEFNEIMEMSMRNLLYHGDVIDTEDFLRRADGLQAVGKTVLVSKFARFHRLAAYLHRYTHEPVGIILGAPLLEELLDEKWYDDLDGGILEAVGRLFKHGIKLYVYPSWTDDMDKPVAAADVQVAGHLHHLFRHLIENKFIEPLVACEEDSFHHSSQEVRTMIETGDPRWKQLVPELVVPLYQSDGKTTSAPSSGHPEFG